jgi:hypothetical protein
MLLCPSRVLNNFLLGITLAMHMSMKIVIVITKAPSILRNLIVRPMS